MKWYGWLGLIFVGIPAIFVLYEAVSNIYGIAIISLFIGWVLLTLALEE